MVSHTLMLYLAPEASRDICSVDRLRSLKVGKIPLSAWQCLHVYVESSIDEDTNLSGLNLNGSTVGLRTTILWIILD